MSVSHITMASYYQLLFALKLNGWSVDEVEELIAFERDIYVSLLQAHLEKSKDK